MVYSAFLSVLPGAPAISCFSMTLMTNPAAHASCCAVLRSFPLTQENTQGTKFRLQSSFRLCSQIHTEKPCGIELILTFTLSEVTVPFSLFYFYLSFFYIKELINSLRSRNSGKKLHSQPLDKDA